MSTEKKTKTGIWALMAKLGSKFASIGVKLLKGFKFTKIGLAALSLAGYAAIFNWKFGILLMVAVGFHESGHVWAMKKMGIKTKGFYFLPFIGGAAIAEEQYSSYGQNAYVSIMGPIWGAALAMLCAAGYVFTGMPMLAAAAAWMATLNLFNLLPITPLDGGQLMRSIAFSIHKTAGLVFLLISITAGIILMWKLHIGIFALLLLLAGLELFWELRFRLKGIPNPAYPRYPSSMNAKQLALTVVSYVGTIAVLLFILFSMQKVEGASLAKQFLE